MQFEFEERIDLPQSKVYGLLRQRLTDLVPYLDSVDHIEQLERTEADDGTMNVTYQWRGNRSGFPLMARPFVTKAMLTWKDHGLWPSGSTEVHWKFEPAKFKTLFTCGGVNYIEADGDDITVLRITGDLELYTDRIPGISKRMAKKLEPKLTPWILEKIRPNLMQVPHALKAFVSEAPAD